MSRPPLVGLRHLALWIPATHFDATVEFYREVVGMALQWQPDPDNVYLSAGTDNLALHRVTGSRTVEQSTSPLDHLGFFVPTAADVAVWEAWVEGRGAPLGASIEQRVKTHRDGATSFYARDPAGHLVQFLHLPAADPTG